MHDELPAGSGPVERSDRPSRFDPAAPAAPASPPDPLDPLDPLDEDIIAEVEDLAATMPAAELAAVLEQRAEALDPGAPGRAAWLVHAAERWEMARDLDRARGCYERAVADGGSTFLDPRIDLVGIWLDTGENARAEEMLELLRAESRAGRITAFMHERLGEILELHDRLPEALRWFDVGLVHRHDSLAEEVDDLALGCLNGHYRVRRALGLPLDRYDALCESRRQDRSARLGQEQPTADAPAGASTSASPGASTGASTSASPDAAGAPSGAPVAVTYWPPREFDLVLARWPDLTEAYGEDHAEHRALVEGHLRTLAENHVRVLIATARFEDYYRFAEERGAAAASASTRAVYAAHLASLDKARPWPPGRNEPCWCGSQRKYKRCCGALRFG